MKHPKIKICGIKSTREAEYLNQAKVDYAGFVFYEKSKRNLTMEEAKKIKAALAPEIKTVAVTVSPTPELVKEIEAAGFDLIQIHGTLSREVLDGTKLPIWRAVNIKSEEQLAEDFAGEVKEAKEKITGYVADGAGYGGGKPFDWEHTSESVRTFTAGKQLILAGGLNAENVAPGIHFFQPDVVDVSSSVEDAYGKNKTKIDTFVRKVREHE